MMNDEGSKRQAPANQESIADAECVPKKVKPDEDSINEPTNAKAGLKDNEVFKTAIRVSFAGVGKRPKRSKFDKPAPKTASGLPSNSVSKPDWAKLKKEKRELLANRQKKRLDDDITVEAKKLWQELRRERKGNCTPIALKLHNLLKTHLSEIIMGYDISRIVQWLIKLGTPEIRVALTEELQPFIDKMLTSKHAVACVKVLLKYGTTMSRGLVMEAFMGKVVKLMSNPISSPVLEYAYAEWATPVEKNRMRQEFYSELYKFLKDDQIKCLADTFGDIPVMKVANLESTKTNISRVINKCMSQSSLLYAVMLDFLKECNNEDRDEILGNVREWLPIMPDIKDAAHIGMMCVWYATDKEKKAVMKSLKEKIMDMAKSDHLHWILLALIDSTDDTVVLSEIVLPEVINNVIELAEDKFGQRIVVHLVGHCDATLFHPKEIEIFKEGEVSGTAKKAPELRKKEILDVVSKPFLLSVAEDPKIWFSSSAMCLVAISILKAGCGEERQKAFMAIAKLVADPSAEAEKEALTETSPNAPNTPPNMNNTAMVGMFIPLVAHDGINFAIKKLIQNDDKAFSKALTEELSQTTLELWLTQNRGCFLLVDLLETKDEIVVAKIKDLLKPLEELLNAQDSTGANILKKYLAAN